MKFVLLNQTHVGEILALPIYNAMGVCFLKAGTTLTEFAIKKVMNMGCSCVYLESSTEIILEQTFPTDIHFDLTKKLTELFVNIKKNKYVELDKIENITQLFMENINLSANSILITNPSNGDAMAELAEHVLEVAMYAARIALKCNFNRDKLKVVISAALLHDVGKLITDEQLHMNGTYEMLKSNPLFGPTLYITILQMYENIDGSGPLGLKEENIYENAQILHIANHYSKNLYKENIPDQALEEIVAHSTSKFSSTIFRASLESVYCYPNGLSVELNTGEIGIITEQNIGMPLRPVVTISDTQEVKDLSSELTVFISKVIL